MTNTRKALFLSALVLPGLGQLTLKRYKTGIAIIFSVVISLYNIMGIVMEQANSMVSEILMQGGVLDIQTILNTTAQITGSTTDSAYSQYMWILIACWLLSMFDVWFTGKKLTGKNINP